MQSIFYLRIILYLSVQEKVIGFKSSGLEAVSLYRETILFSQLNHLYMISVLALCKKGVFIENLRPFLRSSDIDIVAICTDSENALRKFQKTRPDIVIMDANWPVHPNFIPAPEFIQRLREVDPMCKIIIMTNTHEPDISAKFKNLNISGYFYRNMNDVISTIIALVKSVYSEEAYFEK